jgi:carbon-monoxide dehydrogenase medium subunit
VKAGAFDYIRATSLAQALTLLAEHGDDATVLAGGQSLMPALNLRLSIPALLIDIGRLEELRGIALQDGVLRLGALTRHAELLTAPLVQAHAPLLSRAIVHVAHPAIRSRGTLGGSLANADPAAELPACALALQARLVLRSVRGERIVPAAAFFTGLFETALAADEILTAVEIDAQTAGSICGFQELARRSGDYAIVGLAAQGQIQDGQLHSIQLGYFSVGPRATLASGAAATLVGRPLDLTVIEEAAQALEADLTPHDDLQASAATRLHLARVLLRRVVGEMAHLA